jgi:hypothetical protein
VANSGGRPGSALALAASILAVVPGRGGTGLRARGATFATIAIPTSGFSAWSAQCFELLRFKRTFGYTPSSAVTVMLNDYSGFGNAARRRASETRPCPGTEPLDRVRDAPPNER